MGRHKKMASAAEPSAAVRSVMENLPTPRVPVDFDVAAGTGQLTLLPDLDPHTGPKLEPAPIRFPADKGEALRMLQRQRHSELMKWKPANVTTTRRWKAAVAAVASAPTTLAGDKRTVADLIQLLEFDEQIYGELDVLRSLHRSNISRFVEQGLKTQGPSSRATTRSRLQRIGRTLYPQEYGGSTPIPRKAPLEPATELDVRRIYRAAESLPTGLAESVLAVADLSTGVGARAEELRRVTGGDVTLDTGPIPATWVRLVNRQGVVRQVPVIDPAKAARLRSVAAMRGPTGTLLPGTGGNQINELAVRMAKRGVHVPLLVPPLRNSWILALAGRPVPTALLMLWGDLGDSHTLHQLFRHMATFESVGAAKFLQGGVS